jgi:hypothetical protein
VILEKRRLLLPLYIQEDFSQKAASELVNGLTG